MNVFKNFIKKVIITSTRFFSKTKIGRYANELIIEDVMQRKENVKYNDIKMQFAVPNHLNQYRVDTFSIKEPETLNWIDSLPEESELWDVGANIGLYSIYAAKKKKCNVFNSRN